MPPLDCHRKVELASYMTPLNPATDIATKLSPNKYWPSRGILLPLMILICLSVFFYFHEIIEEPRKMQYPDTDLRIV